MKIKLMTDAIKHNLALMKISTYHKEKGDTVFLGNPTDDCDLSYASYLFAKKANNHTPADITGGPAVDIETRLPIEIERCRPDYSLYDVDYSIGYTWAWCPRKCEFCIVPKQDNPRAHHSIWDFHDPKFNKICLLNNNTFSDPQWRKTFEEIWDAKLTVVDQNGYDLRLLDDEKATYLKQTKFDGLIHFAWDNLSEYRTILQGMQALKQAGLTRSKCRIYVLVGYPDYRPIDGTDIQRCQVIHEQGFAPYVMVYNKRGKRYLNRFQRMVNGAFTWRKLGFEQAWKEYK